MTTNSNDQSARDFLNELLEEPLTLGNALWSIRECDELSQAAMAKKLGISSANLCDIEKGRKLVSPDRAARWAKLLGYHEGQFIRLSLQDHLRASGLNYVVQVEPGETRNSGEAA